MGGHIDHRIRTQIAEQAARIILDEGVKDYQLAKRKAAERLGIQNRRALPRNTEVDDAIRLRQQLFFTAEDHQYQSSLWRAALSAMQFLANFKPRLVGSVLAGTAGKHSNVNLHLFADSLEEVLFLFLDAGVAYHLGERRLRYGCEYKNHPCLQFLEADLEVEAVVLPDMRLTPLSPIDGKPVKRADLKEVQRRYEALRCAQPQR